VTAVAAGGPLAPGALHGQPLVPAGYRRPATFGDALRALAEDGAMPLAGGTDVVPMRNDGAIAPRVLVDVKHVPELHGVDAVGAGWRIGAATTFERLCAERPPGLDAVLDGAAIVGAPQTRSRGTLGGNVCRASPAGDALCGLLVLDAVLELRGADGAREVPAAAFFTGPGRTVRDGGELLVAIRFPGRPGGSAYRRFTYRRAMDLAVAGVAARVELVDGTCASAALAIGAVAPTPRLVPEAAAALAGTPCDEPAIAAACEAALAAATPIDDVRGAARHRRRVLPVLARRVLADALARAREGRP
jgi:carbon-monoxide dehydrogenase medium subunit